VPQRLREQARSILDEVSGQAPADVRAEPIRRTARTLLNYLAEEADVAVRSAAAPELEPVRARLVAAPTPGEDEQSLRAMACSARSRHGAAVTTRKTPMRVLIGSLSLSWLQSSATKGVCRPAQRFWLSW